MTDYDDLLQTEEQHFRGALAAIAAQDRRRRRAGLALTSAVVVLAGVWLFFSVNQVRILTRRANELRAQTQDLQKSVQALQARSADLARTQEDLLNFLRDVASQESIRLVDPGVNWDETKARLLAMPAGTRKSVLLSAILLAWKAIPFSLSNVGLKEGLDSPHFINLILRRYDVHVQQRPNQRLSDAMMSQFEKVDMPLPGDLIFYRGNVGNFVVMYIAPGRPRGKGVAVGTLQTGEELRVLDTADINTPVYPFIGYFRVPYPEAKQPRSGG